MAHILLAEDDKSMREFLTIALGKAGHNVTAKEDGLAALAALDDEKAAFDLLLTDIVMPGMDGIELAQNATRKSPDLKIMFITGFTAVAMDIKPQEQTKNARLLSKPFHLKELVGQVDTLLKTGT